MVTAGFRAGGRLLRFFGGYRSIKVTGSAGKQRGKVSLQIPAGVVGLYLLTKVKGLIKN